MYYYHTDFFRTGQEGSTAMSEASTQLPTLAPKDSESDMRQWLEQRRAQRKTSGDVINVDSALIAPMGRHSFNETPRVEPPLTTSPVIPSTNRSGEANERMERWLKQRQSVKLNLGQAQSPLDLLAAISPIRSADESLQHRGTESFPKENSDSSNNTAGPTAGGGDTIPRPPPDAPQSTTPPRTAMAKLDILSRLGTPPLSRKNSDDSTDGDKIGRPRSFYREYVETQRKREVKEQQLAAAEEAARAASEAMARDAEESVTAAELGVIEEEEEEDSDGEDEEFDTGAAASALMRMQELHQEEKNRQGKNGSRKSIKTRNSVSKKNSVLGMRKNSEAQNATFDEILMNSGGSSRKNSKAQNSLDMFSDDPTISRKRSNRPYAPPARSKNTVMKRFQDGKTELQQKLSEKELAAKEQLQARLEKRNKHAAEVAAMRRASEKGWK